MTIVVMMVITNANKANVNEEAKTNKEYCVLIHCNVTIIVIAVCLPQDILTHIVLHIDHLTI